MFLASWAASEGVKRPFGGGREFASVQAQFGFGCIDFGVGIAGTIDWSELAAYELFNLTKVFVLISCNKGNGVSGGLGPSCSADAMNVVFRNDGHIEIYDVRDACDIDATSGDIGCDHDAVPAVFEAVHSPLPLALVTA